MSKPYSEPATSLTPVLIIYLLDISGSMGSMLDNRTRIKIVSDALEEIAYEMVARSTKGEVISPRYRLAILAYENQVHDILNGIQTIEKFVEGGIPEFQSRGQTDTAGAFRAAEELLKRELPNMQHCPAPLICHMTDGHYTTDDPTPIAERIMQMGTADGNVLIENIFISDSITKQPVTNIQTWLGIEANDLTDNYAQILLNMSSKLPESYAAEMVEYGYNLQAGKPMMFPGQSMDLIRMAFTVSGATAIVPTE